MIQIDSNTWVRKEDVTSITFTPEGNNYLTVVLYVGRRTVSTTIQTSERDSFIAKFK